MKIKSYREEIKEGGKVQVDSLKKEHSKRVYVFSSTPGHGYLKVPKKDIYALGMSTELVNFFYDRGNEIEIEEDEDAPEFIRRAKEAGWNFEVEHRDVDDTDYPWPPIDNKGQ